MAKTQDANDALRRGETERSKQRAISELRCQVLGSLIESSTKVESSTRPAFDVGIMLDNLFKACGYEL